MTRGLLLALALTGACAGARRFAADLRYDQHLLPGFDGYVYLAMAERPGTFTVAPWGYRVLTPFLAHHLPRTDLVSAFTWLTLGALTASGGLLFLFLRRLGHGEAGSLVAVFAFALSAPVAASVRNPFLTEPLALLFELLLLLALQAGQSIPMLGLVLVLGELTKEVFVLFLPGVFLFLREERGTRRALAATAALGILVGAVHIGLRVAWVPYPPLRDGASWSVASLAQAVERTLAAWPEWWAILGATGFPLAVIAVFLKGARGFVRRYAGFLTLTLALPFAVAADWAPGGARRSAPFLPEDVERLLIYSLSFLLPLALVALEELQRPRGLFTAGGPKEARPGSRPWVSGLAAAATAVLVCATPFGLDRYRRFDLRTRRDGPHVLALARESPRFAARLEQGRPVFYDLMERRYRPGRDDRRYLERMRWFLISGLGPNAYYESGPAVFRSGEAAFLLPCFTPRDLDVVVTVENRAPLTLEARVNGVAVFREDFEPAPTRRFVLRAPARRLFRGDNLITLALLEGEPASIALRSITVRPVDNPLSPR